jgi:hypothetical protein
MKWLGWVLAAAIAAWTLRPALKHLQRDEVDLALEQLAGQGCQFQEGGAWTPNPFAEFSTRHPSYHCRIFAAQRLVKEQALGASKRAEVLRGLEVALTAMPAAFDTGDGVIQYRATIQSAMDAFRSPGPGRE